MNIVYLVLKLLALGALAGLLTEIVLNALPGFWRNVVNLGRGVARILPSTARVLAVTFGLFLLCVGCWTFQPIGVLMGVGAMYAASL